MRFHVTLLLSLLLTQLTFAQQTRTIEGVLQDVKGENIPFANVYVDGTTIGTTSNMDGEFTLKIKDNIDADIIFQYIGYTKKTLPISYWDTKIQAVIVLEKENFKLSTFTVSASGKDPAYAIIKQAQKQRKKYLKQIKEYSGRVYMKGGAYLTEIPKNIPFLSDSAMPDSSDIGLLGLTESVANFHFKKPNQYKEEMLASKISGFSNGYSWNRANQVIYNFYETFVQINGISDRAFLSPIAPTAMASYNFKLEGVFNEDGYAVNKILVSPKRDVDLLFHGYIYITEELWNIYAIDLYLCKPTPLQMADTVKFKQGYALINEEIWLPRSLEMEVHFKFLGFGVTYHAVGMFSNYDVTPNFSDDFFSNEVLLVTDTVKKIDSTFWEKSRQVELTSDEKINYHKGDSIEARMNSPEYLDSLDAKSNKVKTMDLLLGFTHKNRHKKRNWSIDPPLTIVQYNTVEGLVIHPKVRIRDYSDKKTSGRYVFGLRYGHQTKTFLPQFEFSKSLNKKKLSGFSFSVGEDMRQINNSNPISEEYNTFYTLQSEQNFAKYYRSKFVNLRYQQEILNGWSAGVELGYEQRISEHNRSDYKWKDINHRVFSPNIAIKENDRFHVNLASKITLQQKYETYPDKKVVIGSTWPDFYVFLNNAFATQESDASYHQLKLAIKDNISLGNFGRLYYTGQVGKFFSHNNLSFVDYEHFNGNEIAFTPEISSTPYLIGSELENLMKFHTLAFYNLSTNNAFVEAHVEHHFNGFIINKIPLLRRSKFQAVAGANALYTDALKEFTELYVGLENILSIIRIDVAAGYTKGGKIEPVLRFAVKANF
jgi:hypothetical protein